MALIPVAPTLSAPTASGFTITVNADGNPSPPATYYTFKIMTGAGVYFVNALGVLQATKVYLPVLSITVLGAVPNTLHTVILTAADDAIGTNESVDGPPATVTTLAAPPIGNGFAFVYSTTAQARWVANGNPDGTEYEVQLSTDASFISNVTTFSNVTDIGYTFIDLIPLTPYYVRVRASNTALVFTSYTFIGSFVSAQGPDTVKAIRVFNLLAERGYLITWQPNQEINMFKYRVYRSESPTDFTNFQSLGEVLVPVTSFVDRVPFTFGIVFYYIVTAIDDGGNESSLVLTTPAQENSYHSFEEQPFFNTIVSSDFITDEVPTGAVDTVNTLFVTAFPYRKGSVEIYLNGVKLLPTIDFNEGPQSQQITFVNAPDTGGVLRINYKKFGI